LDTTQNWGKKERKKERKKEKTLLHTSLFYTLCTTDRVKKSAED